MPLVTSCRNGHTNDRNASPLTANQHVSTGVIRDELLQSARSMISITGFHRANTRPISGRPNGNRTNQSEQHQTTSQIRQDPVTARRTPQRRASRQQYQVQPHADSVTAMAAPDTKGPLIIPPPRYQRTTSRAERNSVANVNDVSKMNSSVQL